MDTPEIDGPNSEEPNLEGTDSDGPRFDRGEDEHPAVRAMNALLRSEFRTDITAKRGGWTARRDEKGVLTLSPNAKVPKRETMTLEGAILARGYRIKGLHDAGYIVDLTWLVPQEKR